LSETILRELCNCAYYGIHTFRFINRKGETTLVKFRFVPRDGEKQLSNAEMQSAPRDFLERALSERTKKDRYVGI